MDKEFIKLAISPPNKNDRRLIMHGDFIDSELVDILCSVSSPNMVHENTLLSLDVTKAYRMLNWKAMLNFYEAIEYTVDWYKEVLHNDDMFEYCKKQIQNHMDKGYLWEQ